MKKTAEEAQAKTQGAKAVETGIKQEEIIREKAIKSGFVSIKYKDYIRENDPSKKYIVSRVPYTTIFGGKGYTEFVLIANGRKIRIESKYQNSQGSVREKLPYMIKTAMKAYEERETVFVIEGSAIESERKWFKDELKRTKKKQKRKGRKLRLIRLEKLDKFFAKVAC